MRIDRLPEISRIVVVDPVDIDQIGVPARLVADDTALLVAADIDGEGETVADRLARRERSGRGLHEADLLVQPPECCVTERRRAAADAQLHETRASAHQNAERARRNLRIKRPLVAIADAVELGAVVSDDAGKDIETTDRALRVGEP